MHCDYDYPYIRAWGRLLGSFQYYVDAEIELARKTNAPYKAIYQHPNGEWVTFDNIKLEEVKSVVDAFVKKIYGREHYEHDGTRSDRTL